MKSSKGNSATPNIDKNSAYYAIVESLKHPAIVLSKEGELIYGNKSFHDFFKANKNDLRLDWEHPLFPEYRKQVAQAYISALQGQDKQCFAVVNTPEGTHLPVEIYTYPLINENTVTAILALIKVVDHRFMSFDQSTFSLISDDNFHNDNQHFEFSPMPILRIDDNLETIKCSHSLESLLGYTASEIIEKKIITFKSIFLYDAERVTNSISAILSGEISFQRIGEIKISTRSNEEKIVNLVIYPIIEGNKITFIEIVMEDITLIKELKEKINIMNRLQVLGDITKGFLHSLNNSINIILSKTQLLLQITEKNSVTEGIQLIEQSSNEIVEQIRRVQNFIGDQRENKDDTVEDLVEVIEDAIEFARMQFKVEDKENRRSITIDRKYYTSVNIQTNTRLLTEIIISIILKVSAFIQKKGTLNIQLKENNDLYLGVATDKEGDAHSPNLAYMVNIFSRIDIRQVAEKINIKIIEEESADSYAIKAFFPARSIINKKNIEPENIEYRLRDLDIIIVEDEKALQEILFEVFDGMGNRVFICEKAPDAIAEFKKKHYDIVISDYGLQGMTGIELSARLKEIDENTTTILLSGWMISDINAYKNVIDLFMPKPFKLDNLIKNISKIQKEKTKRKG